MGDFGQAERDLLIRVDENVKAIKGDLKEHVGLDEKNVKRWIAVPVIGFLIMLIIGAYGFTYKTSEKINNHQSDVKIHRTIETVKALKE